MKHEIINHYFLPISLTLPYTMYRECMRKDSDTAVLLWQTEKMVRNRLSILPIHIISITRCQRKANMTVILGHSH